MEDVVPIVRTPKKFLVPFHKIYISKRFVMKVNKQNKLLSSFSAVLHRKQEKLRRPGRDGGGGARKAPPHGETWGGRWLRHQLAQGRHAQDSEDHGTEAATAAAAKGHATRVADTPATAVADTKATIKRWAHSMATLHTIHHTIFVDLTEPDGRKGQNSGFSRSSKYQLWTIRMDYLQFCPLSRSPRCIILHEGSRTTPHWRQFPTEYK